MERKKYDAVIVLGRGIYKDGSIPESVKAATRKAIGLYRQGIVSKVIFSGRWSRHFDYIPPTTEARAMQSYAFEQGLPPEAVVVEEKSLDTITNCYFIKTDILIPRHWRNVLLLTMHHNDERAPFLMRTIFGPDYSVDTLSIDFQFKPETLKRLEETEPAKLKQLKEFTKDVTPGDHETIYQMQQEYVENNH